MPNYKPQYNALFNYLSEPLTPPEAYPTIVFGRNDPRVARAAADLGEHGLLGATVITGGIGKDSGDIGKPGSPYRSEAQFLGVKLNDFAAKHDIALPRIILEEHARHGGENAEFSLRELLENGSLIGSLTTVAHATSLRRLAATVDFKAQTKHGIKPVIYRVPSAYEFHADNPIDQQEAVAEMSRLIDWPKEGMLLEQPDLPGNLVDFVTSVKHR